MTAVCKFSVPGLKATTNVRNFFGYGIKRTHAYWSASGNTLRLFRPGTIWRTF
jgi:hypothetical protein